jgi:hypothetical protein
MFHHVFLHSLDYLPKQLVHYNYIFVLVNPVDFVLLAAEVTKILDNIDAIVDHGVISKIPLVFFLELYFMLFI